MIKKRFMTLLMIGVMVLALAGCGNNAETSTEAPETEAKVQTEAVVETDAPETEDNGYHITWEDKAEVVFVYPSMGALPAGLQAVEDAMNAITEEKINVHITLNVIEVGNYDQQINLMMSSNEQLDLMITMPAGPASLSTMASQNQLLDITDMLAEYAPNALSVVGDLIKGTSINGKTVGFPIYRGLAGGKYINMRTDVLEDLGLLEKAQNMTTFTEYEEILEAVKNSEKWGYLAGVCATDGNGSVLPDMLGSIYVDTFAECISIDTLGNTQFMVAAGADGVVYNTFAAETFKNNYEMVRGWYEKGYVYKDSATTSEMGTELIKSNVAFSHIAAIELGGEGAQDVNCGMDMTSVLVKKDDIATSSLTKFVYAVPSIAKEPEAAVTFLQLLFEDIELANLMAWGIEGVDYEIGADGVAGFIEGNETPAYHNVEFLNVNKFLLHPWTGDDPNRRELSKEYMKECTVSPYLGFSGDVSAISAEISAITNVIAEYQAQVASGVADAATYDAFLEKLETSGIGKVVDLYQTQLDEWMITAK